MSRHYSSQEERETLQPLGKDGYASEAFGQVYPGTSNPYKGTERDRGNKGHKLYFRDGFGSVDFEVEHTDKCSLCGQKFNISLRAGMDEYGKWCEHDNSGQKYIK